MPLPSNSRMRTLTIGSFIVGVSLYGVGLYYAFVNIGPDQEMAQVRKKLLKEWLRDRADVFLGKSNDE